MVIVFGEVFFVLLVCLFFMIEVGFEGGFWILGIIF